MELKRVKSLKAKYIDSARPQMSSRDSAIPVDDCSKREWVFAAAERKYSAVE